MSQLNLNFTDIPIPGTCLWERFDDEQKRIVVETLARDGGELPAMVGGAVMRLAEQHDGMRRRPRHRIGDGAQSGRDPLPGWCADRRCHGAGGQEKAR